MRELPLLLVFAVTALVMAIGWILQARSAAKAHAQHVADLNAYWRNYVHGLQKQNDDLNLDVERMSSRNSILAEAVRDDALSKALTVAIPQGAWRYPRP
jgi:cell division protein FtsL